MRNRLAKINLESALASIWSYSMFIEFGQELPAQLRSPDHLFLRKNLQQWQLAELAREVIMHCDRVSGAPFTFKVFASTLNCLRSITVRLSADPLEIGQDSMFQYLDAILHQQYPLQVKMNAPQVLRYRSIFGSAPINEMMCEKLGFGYDECSFFLFALSGLLHKKPRIVSSQSYEKFNISEERTASLFSWLSAPVAELAAKMKNQHAFDVNWASRWNELRSKPFVQHDLRNSDHMYCPVPAVLWQKISQGLAFDLYSFPGFDKAFGTAFEEHVVGFAEYHLSSDKFTVAGEQEFTYKKNVLNGADLMVSDEKGTIVVECKTKRLNLNARQFDPGDSKLTDLAKLAKAVVQLYKNIAHIKAGSTQWKPRSNRYYPVVVTLEDWLLFSPKSWAEFDALVKECLLSEKMSLDLLEQSPFTIASCAELEQLLLVINESSVGSVMEEKTKPQHRQTMLKGYLTQYHQEELRSVYPSAYSEKFDIFHQRMIKAWHPKNIE